MFDLKIYLNIIQIVQERDVFKLKIILNGRKAELKQDSSL